MTNDTNDASSAIRKVLLSGNGSEQVKWSWGNVVQCDIGGKLAFAWGGDKPDSKVLSLHKT